MSQLDHPAAWRKAHRRRLALVGLGPVELLLVLVLDVVGVRNLDRRAAGEQRHDVGWATRDDGRALSRRELAALVRLAPGAAGLAELEAALAGLVELGHVVVADDGAVGVVGWVELQESPEDRRARDDERRAREAERKRAARARSSGERPPPSADAAGTSTGQSADSPAPSADKPADLSRERSEDRGQINSDDDAPRTPRPTPTHAPAPPSLGRRIALARESMGFGLALVADRSKIPPATLRAIEQGEAVPTGAELVTLARVLGDPGLAGEARVDRDPGVVEHAVDALYAARCALVDEAQKRGESLSVEHRPAVTGDLVRDVWGPERAGLVPPKMTLGEAWTLVIRRALEEARRNAEDGRGRRDLEFFTLRSLASPAKWRRYLGNADLDVRRAPAAKARGQPAALAKTGTQRTFTTGRKKI